MQGLLQNPTAWKAPHPLWAPASAWQLPHGEMHDLQNPKLPRQPLSWLVPNFLTEKLENYVLVVHKTSARHLEGLYEMTMPAPAFEVFNGFWHISKYSFKFLWRSEGLSPMKSYSDYCLQMTRKSIPHGTAAGAFQYSLYSCVGLSWARPLSSTWRVRKPNKSAWMSGKQSLCGYSLLKNSSFFRLLLKGE